MIENSAIKIIQSTFNAKATNIKNNDEYSLLKRRTVERLNEKFLNSAHEMKYITAFI